MTVRIAAQFFALIAFVMFLTQGATAISRYNAKVLTCQGAKQVVSNEGAVILRYPSKRNANITLYDRFVKNSRRCASGEYAARKSIPTKDKASCRLKYCKPIEPLIERHLGGFGFGID